MFRPIRRKKNELSRAESEELLLRSRSGVLAVNGDDGYPYAIPVNYFYDADARKIYFHGSRAGHKADALKGSDKVCFTVIGPEMIKKEAWAPFVRSVVAFGRCHAVTQPEEAAARLWQLAKKYYPDEDLIREEISAAGKAVQMYELEIEHMSCKEIQER